MKVFDPIISQKLVKEIKITGDNSAELTLINDKKIQIAISDIDYEYNYY